MKLNISENQIVQSFHLAIGYGYGSRSLAGGIFMFVCSVIATVFINKIIK